MYIPNKYEDGILTRHHFSFPSGMIIEDDPENDFGPSYREDLKTKSVEEVVAYWKYLIPDIDNKYDQKIVDSISSGCSLAYFTENFIKPQYQGDLEKGKYVNLLYPHNFMIFGCIISRSWVGDLNKKIIAKFDNECLFALHRHNCLEFNNGYLKINHNAIGMNKHLEFSPG